ncbi:hypothetical protein CCC_03124 [Paramagnetospirillum magnetotacticum MS-1]|uniref:Uncharacterized protein n=1 Tax=Paramagnetospirillum magnetotacticum MS-1 TaxID=272627 RepID=A0A0C2V622_PARME|nr:hypothetical protein [Paramagnetospirillum magnetotacticum]KIM00522.1 hypothetical protein CCC_03124 [Paramagnetospirillum magnetotacticum MS-1]
MKQNLKAAEGRISELTATIQDLASRRDGLLAEAGRLERETQVGVLSRLLAGGAHQAVVANRAKAVRLREQANDHDTAIHEAQGLLAEAEADLESAMGFDRARRAHELAQNIVNGRAALESILRQLVAQLAADRAASDELAALTKLGVHSNMHVEAVLLTLKAVMAAEDIGIAFLERKLLALTPGDTLVGTGRSMVMGVAAADYLPPRGLAEKPGNTGIANTSTGEPWNGKATGHKLRQDGSSAGWAA